MNEKERHLLKNFQNFMRPHEKMVARWLIEEWNGADTEMPSWLRNRVRNNFPHKDLSNPNALARLICLKLLECHKNEISLHDDKI